MNIVFKDQGWDRIITRVVATGVKRTRRGIRQGFFAIGDDFMNELNRQVLRTPKRGRIYIRRTRTGRRRKHRASAPGQSHANFSGTLRKSADYKIQGQQMAVGYLDDPPDYDVFVELGTRRMRPRPTVQNSLKGIRKNSELNLRTEIVKAWEEGY